jgi:hypothetical protein
VGGGALPAWRPEKRPWALLSSYVVFNTPTY